MKDYKIFDEIPLIKNAVIALGNFDGMHLAHRHLVEKVCQGARAICGNSVIISFLPPPRKTVSQKNTPCVLSTEQEKGFMLSKIGVNKLITMKLTPEISNMNYIDFIHFLQTKMDIKKIVLGYNHHFGKDREGCYETLLPLGKELHFEVEKIEKQTIDGLDISSSAIRYALHCGDIETANKLLGYNYYIFLRTTNKKKEIRFDRNKLFPKYGRYTVKIDEQYFTSTVEQHFIAVEGLGKEYERYRVEFISGIE